MKKFDAAAISARPAPAAALGVRSHVFPPREGWRIKSAVQRKYSKIQITIRGAAWWRSGGESIKV